MKREDIGTLTFVVGLTEDSADALPRIPWHAIVAARSGVFTAWIATDCDRAPFLTGRMPSDMATDEEVLLPVFAARNSLADTLRLVRHLEVLDWSVLVVKALLCRRTCGFEEFTVASIHGHRLASAAASPPGLWSRIASTLVEGEARVAALSCEAGFNVFDLLALLSPATASLGVCCRLVSHDGDMRCGIIVMGAHGEIKGAVASRAGTGPSVRSPRAPAAFAVALPRATCKGVAGGRFLGLWFQTVSRRTQAALAQRSTNAEVRALESSARAGQKRSRSVDSGDL
jgi:hypothetical protein